MRFISAITLSAAYCVNAFGGKSSLGVQEDVHGLADPATYESAVFKAPESYSSSYRSKPSSSFLQSSAVESVDLSSPVRAALRKVEQLIHKPLSLLQTKSGSASRWTNFFNPFSSLQEAKAAQIRLTASEEQLADKEAITRSKIEVFKTELQSQIDAARKEKKAAEERMAKRGLASSSFVQTALQSDMTSRELEKINEMQRSWKLAADRLAHSELASVTEPDAALIDANSKVEADRKRINRLTALVNADLQEAESPQRLPSRERLDMNVSHVWDSSG